MKRAPESDLLSFHDREYVDALKAAKKAERLLRVFLRVAHLNYTSNGLCKAVHEIREVAPIWFAWGGGGE